MQVHMSAIALWVAFVASQALADCVGDLCDADIDAMRVEMLQRQKLTVRATSSQEDLDDRRATILRELASIDAQLNEHRDGWLPISCADTPQMETCKQYESGYSDGCSFSCHGLQGQPRYLRCPIGSLPEVADCPGGHCMEREWSCGQVNEVSCDRYPEFVKCNDGKGVCKWKCHGINSNDKRVFKCPEPYKPVAEPCPGGHCVESKYYCGKAHEPPAPTPSPTTANCEEGGWNHCWDDECANAMFDRRRRQGMMGSCRRRTGEDSPTRKCCGDLMYHRAPAPPPTPPSPPTNCEEGGWNHCWDDACANSMFDRRRRQGSMGSCRRRTGQDAPTRKCCGDLMYYHA